MRKPLLISLVAAAAILGGCASDRYGSGGDGWGYYDRGYHSRFGAYDYDRPDQRYGSYYADNYYRGDRRYRERYLGQNDRVYRGRNGRYYCRRSDGTTGLIIGGLTGGVVGNIIAPGDSKTLGTILGAIGGAAAGSAIGSNSRDRVRCR